MTVYEIESIPHEDAAVVWGSEVLTIRDDHVVLEHAFFDQDGELVKTLKSLEIAEMGGRTIAKRQRMVKDRLPGRVDGDRGQRSRVRTRSERQPVHLVESA